jgi:hypothetical protein
VVMGHNFKSQLKATVMSSPDIDPVFICL